ncbi:cytochrome P450 [Streptomyces longispororuber]|uniref:cytochrome P450 family protein n=1 Tax=Streptomyces longispororuber TaxID=68230 RepID=UPI0036F4F96F
MPAGTTVDLLQLGPDFVRDPYPHYARLRAQAPVHHVRAPDGAQVYLVLGHEACRAALTDARLSRNWRGSGRMHQIINAAEDDPNLAHMSMADPPDHTRLRRLVTRAFTPRRIQALAPRVQEITDRLLDAMTESGTRTADLVKALAFPLPLTVICELLGVPELDRDAFRHWSDDMLAPSSPQAQHTAYAELGAYLRRLVDAQRARPGQDLLSALIHTVDEDGDRLSPDELVGMCNLLLIAGHETTTHLIAGGLRTLFAHPAQLRLLRADLSLTEGAVEEMLRYDGPVESSLERLALVDVELGGVRIPAGSTVRMVLADADRDGARFERPECFDIRRDARGHIAFGHGLHYCLGAPLARLEAAVALRSLLRRCPDIGPAADLATLEWVPGLLIRGVRTLPVRW